MLSLLCPRLGRLLLLGAALLAGPAAHAQREGDRPPTQDPFGRPLAPEVPGGRYRSHTYSPYGVLTVYATDGSARQVQRRADGVVKIDYYAPGRQPVADSSLSVVEPSLWDEESGISKEEFDRIISQNHQSPPLLLPGKTAKETAAIMRRSKAEYQAALVRQDRNYLRLLIPPYFFLDRRENLYAVIAKKDLRISLVKGSDMLFSEASPAFRRQPRANVPTDAETPAGRSDQLAGTGVRIALQPGERLYGTGARALPLDRRGYRLELYNQAHYGYGNGEPALNVTLPVVLSSRGYLLLFDHHAAAYLDLGKQRPDALEYGVQSLNSLSYYVVTGSSQAEILRRYTALTGRQPLPPRWALGLIQSRFGYRSQAEVLDVARRMRAADFPLDALVLDLYWFGGTDRQGDFAWDAQKFPDPAGMMRELNAQGVRTILISEPYVMRTSRNDSLVRTQQLVGTTAAGRPFTVGSFWAGPASILDVFKPATRTWLWAQYQRLHEQGAGGWWSDLGEPENHPLAMHHRPGTTAQVHNAYGLTWASILQDNYAREYPDERLFNLARSGWAGMQRNAVFPWSGDVSRTWSGLQAQVPIMLSMGQAGVGYMHSDAGGFGANADRDPELYTRWLQMAALCPVLRPHSDQVVPPEPYTYPEPYQSIVRHYTHLRAELLPYLYTLAAENTITGAPLVRALDYYDYGATAYRTVPAAPAPPPPPPGTPDSTRADGWTASPQTSDLTNHYYEWSQLPRRITKMLPPTVTNEQKYGAPPPDNQYYLGNELLVAPVSEPGQRRRNVILPASPGGWVDFETGQTLPGNRVVGLPAPLGRIPLLVRAGAVVPMAAYRPGTAYRPDTLRLRYFPAERYGRSFTVYEDDGHSAQALKHKQFTGFYIQTPGNYIAPSDTTTGWGTAATWRDSASTPGFSLTIHKRGDYAGQPARRWVYLEVLRVAAPPTQVLLNGKRRATVTWVFDAPRHLLTVLAPLSTSTTLYLMGTHLLDEPATGLDPDAQTLRLPGSRTFARQAELRYETLLPASAPLRIRDARGRLVRELATSAAVGPHALTWDGRDAQGQPVPPGYYDVELAGQHQRLVRVP